MMEGKCCIFVKEKSHYLMTTFIVLQGLIFIGLSISLFIEDTLGHKLEIFATLILYLFYGFMVYFAYHSIQKAYYIELIAFLFMSTISSITAVIMIFLFAIDSENKVFKIYLNKSHGFFIFGIIAAIILILGNLIYFITGYFSYEYFEEIFISKLGAKLKFHSKF